MKKEMKSESREPLKDGGSLLVQTGMREPVRARLPESCRAFDQEVVMTFDRPCHWSSRGSPGALG